MVGADVGVSGGLQGAFKKAFGVQALACLLRQHGIAS